MPDNDERVLFRVGTKADYNGLVEKASNILYFITDTGELYKGTVLISTKQRVFNYTTIVPITATAADVFTLAAGANAEKVIGDIVLWRRNGAIMTALWTGTAWVILNESIPAQNVILSNGTNLETALSESALGAVDNETIVNHNNALSLKGFEVEYYVYNNTTQQYNKITVDSTHPWREGLVPRIITYNNDLVFGWVVAEDITALAREVADLQVLNASNTQRISELESTVGSIFTYQGEISDLDDVLTPVNGDVYTVENQNYVWNGTEWVETASILSGYATDAELAIVDNKVTDLANLLGKPAELDSITGEMTPATGLFADYISNVKVGNINLTKTNNTVTLPTFDGTNSGLVPVYTGNANKSSLVLNALGEWVAAGVGGMDSRIGDLTINNIQYNTVEEYVQTAVDAVVLRWETINN